MMEPLSEPLYRHVTCWNLMLKKRNKFYCRQCDEYIKVSNAVLIYKKRMNLTYWFSSTENVQQDITKYIKVVDGCGLKLPVK